MDWKDDQTMPVSCKISHFIKLQSVSSLIQTLCMNRKQSYGIVLWAVCMYKTIWQLGKVTGLHIPWSLMDCLWTANHHQSLCISMCPPRLSAALWPFTLISLNADLFVFNMRTCTNHLLACNWQAAVCRTQWLFWALSDTRSIACTDR